MAGQVVEEGDPLGEWGGGDAVAGVLPRQHGVIGRVAEDQVAAGRLGGKTVADVVGTDLWAGWVEVVSQATSSHRLADIERGPAAGHGVDDQGVGERKVVEGMRDDRWRDGTGVGDSEGSVMPERPDVVRRGAKIGAIAVAAAQVLVRGMDSLGPGVQLGDAALGADITGPGQPPDGSGLAIEIFAADPELPADRRVGSTPVNTLFVDVLIARRYRSNRESPPDRRNSDTRPNRIRPLLRLASRREVASADQSSSRASASRIS